MGDRKLRSEPKNTERVSAPIVKKPKGRIPELDGIRGAAILMVIVWHYFFSQIHPSPHSLLSAMAIPFRLCWSGVDLFFVLSGFLIGGILVDSREAANYFRVFYVRRVCRLGPVYLLLLTSFALVYRLSDPHGRFSWLLEFSAETGGSKVRVLTIKVYREVTPGWSELNPQRCTRHKIRGAL